MYGQVRVRLLASPKQAAKSALVVKASKRYVPQELNESSCVVNFFGCCDTNQCTLTELQHAFAAIQTQFASQNNGKMEEK